MSPSARVTVEGLVAGRGNVTLVGPLDLALESGGALVISGPNGVGKSTLMRTLAGFLAPLAGSVRLEGVLAADGEPAMRLGEAAHYVGHRNAMKGSATVADNLVFWRRFLGSPNLAGHRDAAEEALAKFGLFGVSDLPFASLSAGQQRRASLARLLVAPRPVWILDEPTAALDAASQARFPALVGAHLGAGGMVIAATHQPLGLEGARMLELAPRGDGAEKMAPGEGDIRDAEAEFWL